MFLELNGIAHLRNQGYNHLLHSFFDDSGLLVCICQDGVQLINFSSLEPISTLEIHQKIRCVAVAPRFAFCNTFSICYDNKIEIWEILSGRSFRKVLEFEVDGNIIGMSWFNCSIPHMIIVTSRGSFLAKLSRQLLVGIERLEIKIERGIFACENDPSFVYYDTYSCKVCRYVLFERTSKNPVGEKSGSSSFQSWMCQALSFQDDLCVTLVSPKKSLSNDISMLGISSNSFRRPTGINTSLLETLSVSSSIYSSIPSFCLREHEHGREQPSLVSEVGIPKTNALIESQDSNTLASLMCIAGKHSTSEDSSSSSHKNSESKLQFHLKSDDHNFLLMNEFTCSQVDIPNTSDIIIQSKDMKYLVCASTLSSTIVVFGLQFVHSSVELQGRHVINLPNQDLCKGILVVNDMLCVLCAKRVNAAHSSLVSSSIFGDYSIVLRKYNLSLGNISSFQSSSSVVSCESVGTAVDPVAHHDDSKHDILLQQFHRLELLIQSGFNRLETALSSQEKIITTIEQRLSRLEEERK